MKEFDTILDRHHTNSVKWDTLKKSYGTSDLLPLWVADMDFKAPLAVRQALSSYIDQGILGYTIYPDSLYNAIISWQKRRHDFAIEKEAILFNSGVVPSLSLAVQAYTNPGDAVMIHDPVYPPFAAVVKENGRKLIASPLKTGTSFQMNFEEMEKQLTENQVKLFILCNPHNPGGRVWTKEELIQVGKLCQKHHVLVVSDEIHQDIVYEKDSFTTFQKADPSFKDFSIVLTAATKTFNLAGIKNSMIFIKDRSLKETFQKTQHRNHQDEINTFGIIGTQAAYNHGEQWLDDLLVYLKENIDYTCQFFEQHLPKVKVLRPQATYLIWLDFSAYSLTDRQLQKKMIQEAKVVLNPGITFGSQGASHMRLNVACPRATLEQALTQILTAFKED